MYLLNAEVTLEWEILATANAPALGDLDLLVIDPAGVVTYLDAPIAGGDYTPPTSETVGYVFYKYTPTLEGFHRIRLVTGDSSNYQILSKIEMMVFDNTMVTTPLNDDIGAPFPYDINYYIQGLSVPSELSGIFVTSRTITLATDVPGSRAVATVAPVAVESVFLVEKNGSQVGTITFPVGETDGVISMSPTVLYPGDVLQLKSASSPMDAAISDIAFNIVGCCTVVPCTVL